MKETVLKKVKNLISEKGMLLSGDKVLVAFSGGADSVVMTHALLILSEEMGFTVCAAHLNHSLRGEESDYDELFVRSFCESRGIDLTVEKVDIAALSQLSKEGIEECARNVRYDFLFRTAASIGADRIATAHTLSDNAETLIFNILRGSGLNGLTGIPETRGKLIRPMLKVTRSEIEQYAKEESLPFVTDSTNADTVYKRNYIRKEIIPRFSQINPSFYAAIERLIENVREDNGYFEAKAEKCLALACKKRHSYDLKVLKSFELPIIKRAVSKLYYEFSEQKLSAKNLNAFCDFIIEDPNGRYQLPGGFARKYAGVLTLEKSAERVLPKRFYMPASGRSVLPDGRKVILSEAPAYSFGKNFIDADKLCGELNLRLRSPLDEIKLPKRPTKSLKKLFSESKVPIQERDNAVVLCDESGVVWVEKLGVAERCAVIGGADNIIEISIKE